MRPEQFDALLGSLRGAGYEGISFDQYLAHRRGQGTLPRKPILLTFDDGYKSNAEVAVPILRTHGFTATIFVVPGRLGGSNAWDADEEQETRKARVRTVCYPWAQHDATVHQLRFRH